LTRVFVAAGSNVDPARHLRRAARELVSSFGKVDFSPAYRNQAVGFEGEDFINFVAGFDTALEVREVVSRLQHIEGICGRTRDAPKWAPRSMDLDILLYGDRVCDEPGLVLPRPDLCSGRWRTWAVKSSIRSKVERFRSCGNDLIVTHTR